MDYKEEGAQDYLRKCDETPYDYQYHCAVCKNGFDPGYGYECTEEKFCIPCIGAMEHIKFYISEAGLSPKEANLFTEQNLKPIKHKISWMNNHKTT